MLAQEKASRTQPARLERNRDRDMGHEHVTVSDGGTLVIYGGPGSGELERQVVGYRPRTRDGNEGIQIVVNPGVVIVVKESELGGRTGTALRFHIGAAAVYGIEAHARLRIEEEAVLERTQGNLSAGIHAVKRMIEPESSRIHGRAVPHIAVGEDRLQVPVLGKMPVEVGVHGPAREESRSVGRGALQGDNLSELMRPGALELQSLAAHGVVHLLVAVVVGVAAGVVHAQFQLVLLPAVRIAHAGISHQVLAVGEAEDIGPHIHGILERMGADCVHAGLELPFLQHRRLVVALVHIGRIPLVPLLVQQAAGVAQARIQRAHRQGRVQHSLCAVVVLVLEQHVGHLVRDAGVGALQVVIGREVRQIGAQDVQGALVVSAVGKDIGRTDRERKIVRIYTDAAEGIREGVVGRSQRIAKAPVVLGVDGQDHVRNGLQALDRAAGQFLFQVGIGGFLVGIAQGPQRHGVTGVVKRGLDSLQGRFGSPLLHQQRGIVHGHLVFRIVLEAFLEHEHRHVHLRNFL